MPGGWRSACRPLPGLFLDPTAALPRPWSYGGSNPETFALQKRCATNCAIAPVEARREAGPRPLRTSGDKGIRTPGLLHAMQARYQLRHIPIPAGGCRPVGCRSGTYVYGTLNNSHRGRCGVRTRKTVTRFSRSAVGPLPNFAYLPHLLLRGVREDRTPTRGMPATGFRIRRRRRPSAGDSIDLARKGRGSNSHTDQVRQLLSKQRPAPSVGWPLHFCTACPSPDLNRDVPSGTQPPQGCASANFARRAGAPGAEQAPGR